MVPYLTACLIAMVTLANSFKASAEQRLVDVMFARDVVNREPVGEASEVICVAHFVVG